MKLPRWFACFLMLGVLSHAASPIHIQNGDFEMGPVSWKIFVPPESAGAGCQFSAGKTPAHSGEQAARLTAAKDARFGIRYSQPTPLAVKAGQRYRLSAWVKAGADFAAATGSAGPVLRATLQDRQMKNAPGGHIFVGLKGVQRGEPIALSGEPVPTEWTKIEGDIQVPPGTEIITLFVFCWNTSGSLWIDDVSMEEIRVVETPSS